MAHNDRYDREAQDGRQAQPRDRDDLGQTDYSRDYAYDAETRRGYRVGNDDRPETDGARTLHEPRSWMAGAADVFGGCSRDDALHLGPRRPSDRALWEVVTERLAADGSLDLRRVEVSVLDHEVVIDGFVRRKADKRRVEDLVDIEGVRHVQNNLRVYERSHWTFL